MGETPQVFPPHGSPPPGSPANRPASAEGPGRPVGPDRILLGLNTFGDAGTGPDRQPLAHAVVLRQLLEQAELADAVGLHAFAV
ncbi:MAG: hypothetical protein M3127_01330, partial [Actinomycetota bacterium]|nr:hypothetical protein [Actinomycetota bacterium]